MRFPACVSITSPHFFLQNHIRIRHVARRQRRVRGLDDQPQVLHLGSRFTERFFPEWCH
jgi:hypothetical protein